MDAKRIENHVVTVVRNELRTVGDVIYRVETDAEPTDFVQIVFLASLAKITDTIEVFFFENGFVPTVQSRSSCEWNMVPNVCSLSRIRSSK